MAREERRRGRLRSPGSSAHRPCAARRRRITSSTSPASRNACQRSGPPSTSSRVMPLRGQCSQQAVESSQPPASARRHRAPCASCGPRMHRTVAPRAVVDPAHVRGRAMRHILSGGRRAQSRVEHDRAAGERSASPGSRQVSSGSSAITVPAPTRIASARPAADARRRAPPGPSPRPARRCRPRPRPSASSAIFSCTNGRSSVWRRMWPSVTQRASSAAQADIDRRRRPGATGEAAPGNDRIGIGDGADDAAQCRRRQHGIGTGRHAARVRARLERHVHGPAAGPVAGAPQRFLLGVRTAARLRPAARDHLARRLVGDHGADGRVGRGRAEAAPRHAQGDAHHSGDRRHSASAVTDANSQLLALNASGQTPRAGAFVGHLRRIGRPALAISPSTSWKSAASRKSR